MTGSLDRVRCRELLVGQLNSTPPETWGTDGSSGQQHAHLDKTHRDCVASIGSHAFCHKHLRAPRPHADGLVLDST